MKKHVSELLCAVVMTVSALILLLAGLSVFAFSIKDCLFPVLSGCFFCTSLIVATVQKNRIGLSFCLLFATLLVASIFIAIGYSSRNVYPLYIASVPIGTIGIAPQTPHPRKVFCGASAVIGATILLELEGFGILSVAVVLPMIALYFALIGVIYSVVKIIVFKKTDKEKEDLR